MAIRFGIPQRIVLDDGGIDRLGEYAGELGMGHALLVVDPFLAGSPAGQRVERSLAAAGIASTTFSQVTPNPTVDCVTAGAKAYRSAGCDSIVAVGGGSPMDVTKAIGVIAAYGGEIGDYEGVDRVPGPLVPFLAAPTTAGTGSEVTSFAVITDEARHYKLTVGSRHLLPAIALLDPGLLATVPARVAAACGTDAMVHAIESYTNTVDSTYSGMYSLEALRLIGRHLRRHVARRDDADAARGMMVAANMAGIAFESTRLGLVHAMSHPISAYFHVAHGMANGLLLPEVLEFNALADDGRCARMLDALFGVSAEGQDACTEFVSRIRGLLAQIGVPATLEEAGVDRDAFLGVVDAMSEDAMKSGNIAVNPRAVTLDDVRALYRALP